MLALPLLNVRLRACSETWTRMTPTAQGHHCAHCNRPVLDFTQSSAADLEAAFQASPDGRVCGQFRPEQLATNQPPPVRPALRPKLRRFLVALVLVCGLGLGAHEAAAQVRQAVRTVPPKSPADSIPANRPYGYVEQMPTFKGGTEQMRKIISVNLRYPPYLTESGRVFVGFTIDEAGKQQNVRVVKGFHPEADAEAVRVVRLLNNWTPGTQNGRPVAVKYTVPIIFNHTEE